MRLPILTLLGLAILATTVKAQDRLLEPGDVIRLTCAENPMLCVEQSIGNKGVIRIAGVGPVVAIDMTPKRLVDRLQAIVWDRLGEMDHFEAIADADDDTPIRAEGFIGNPIERRWQPGLTLRDFLACVPPTPEADSRVFTIEPVSGPNLVVDIASANPELHRGDRVIFAPASGSDEVVIVGPVLHAGPIPATRGLTLAKAIEAVGGFTGFANESQIRLYRANGVVLTLDFARDGSVVLGRGDRISVGVTEKQLFVTVSGAVLHQGVVQFRDGMTLSEAVKAAGGLKPGATDYVVLVRILGANVGPKLYRLGRIPAKLDPDPVLLPSDSILVGGVRRP